MEKKAKVRRQRWSIMSHYHLWRPAATIIFKNHSVQTHVWLKRKHFHSCFWFYLTPCWGDAGVWVGGFWFLSSNFKKDTWCYAISRCAMFVLYTGSGEMLLLTTDSGMDWLSVVFILSAVWATSWCCDVMVAPMMSRYRHSGCWWGHGGDNTECCWM